jgi:hypothetical protein
MAELAAFEVGTFALGKVYDDWEVVEVVEVGGVVFVCVEVGPVQLFRAVTPALVDV